ncbi:hypothetical protein PR202_gb11419 [Eleusine coracana subsp. coracana]|uniref:Uncharacterized protein n=1 Tax=Eleusine coracana subsp. coracana TaxID=191504 RepID=A0AAV5EMH1_ELECO|nr:hypothetical protein PR202_gb11419 [Eleusine coracana subsp. coracana]
MTADGHPPRCCCNLYHHDDVSACEWEKHGCIILSKIKVRTCKDTVNLRWFCERSGVILFTISEDSSSPGAYALNIRTCPNEKGANKWVPQLSPSSRPFLNPNPPPPPLSPPPSGSGGHHHHALLLRLPEQQSVPRRALLLFLLCTLARLLPHRTTLALSPVAVTVVMTLAPSPAISTPCAIHTCLRPQARLPGFIGRRAGDGGASASIIDVLPEDVVVDFPHGCRSAIHLHSSDPPSNKSTPPPRTVGVEQEMQQQGEEEDRGHAGGEDVFLSGIPLPPAAEEIELPYPACSPPLPATAMRSCVQELR